jgi:hypothetical protein
MWQFENLKMIFKKPAKKEQTFSNFQIFKLIHMGRSIKKGPYVDANLQGKVDAMTEGKTRKV